MATPRVNDTDVRILQYLRRVGQDLSGNIAAALGKQSRYVNNRLRYMADFGITETPGPTQGLYMITPKGVRMLSDEFSHLQDPEFEATLEDIRPYEVEWPSSDSE